MATKVKDRLTGNIEGLKGKKKLRKIFWYALFFLAILSIFATHYLPEKYPVAEGQVSPSTIRASQTITFEDVKKTAERKQQAMDRVGEVYTVDKSVLPELEAQINDYYSDLTSIVSRSSMDTKEKIAIFKKEYRMSDLAANIFLSLERETIRVLEAESINLLRSHWENGVKESDVETQRRKIIAQVQLLNYNAPFREIIQAVFEKLDLKPNLFPDPEATMKAKEEASRNEGPVLITIRKDQIIVREGEVVTADQMEIIRALGYQRTALPSLTMAGVALFLLLGLVLTIIYMKFYRREIYEKENSMTLLALLVFFTLFLTKLIISLNISPKPEVAELVNYLVPLSMGSMLIAILLDSKVAIFVTVILSFCVGILTDYQLPYAIVAFVGGTVGIYSVSRFSQRLDWVRAGLFVSVANLICVSALSLMHNVNWTIFFISCLLVIVNGLFSTILAYGSLPFLESGFKVTTSVRLLELSNPGQPLLKRLLLEAPGTYHHSILVGNLGEAAAEAIGADALLVRVGSYYHDIGKLKRPYFFIENQLGGENPHEKLAPALSTLIITSHVKDGLELARQYGLPQVIMDLIAQHHGTSLVTYFYHKALEMGNADNIKESDFRYDAAKPQSKEAAIIMLADNVEAAVRSMTSPSPGKIENMVRRIVKERLQDGQLDESDLTFKDVDKIAGAFCRVLWGIFHNRIEYPENVLKAMEGGSSPDANPGGEPAEQDGDD